MTMTVCEGHLSWYISHSLLQKKKQAKRHLCNEAAWSCFGVWVEIRLEAWSSSCRTWAADQKRLHMQILDLERLAVHQEFANSQDCFAKSPAEILRTCFAGGENTAQVFLEGGWRVLYQMHPFRSKGQIFKDTTACISSCQPFKIPPNPSCSPSWRAAGRGINLICFWQGAVQKDCSYDHSNSFLCLM